MFVPAAGHHRGIRGDVRSVTSLVSMLLAAVLPYVFFKWKKWL
jgi:hypothetical protein